MLMRTPLPINIVLSILACVTLFLLFLTRQPYSYLLPSPLGRGVEDSERVNIPNQVHLVYVVGDPTADLRFEFKHYLSIYSTWLYWKPDTIFLHTNADPFTLRRCQDGSSGKWSRLIFELPGITVKNATVPTHAGNGKEINGLEHKSDFVRVKAVSEYGGVYIDLDVYPLRDIKVLRESGFKAIGGRQAEGQVNSGTFMSVKGGRMIELWKEGMHQAYTGGWTTHSNEVITKVGERLVSEPGEMLIMEREAFAPGSWRTDDTRMMFAVHNDVPSNLEGIQEGFPLPLHEEGFSDRWDKPDEFPSWARDWSKTYLLHAFNHLQSSKDIEGFEHITPRYVLERRSNFARAVYPVAKHMYDLGLFSIEDSHLG